jgi:hypothetical protein
MAKDNNTDPATNDPAVTQDTAQDTAQDAARDEVQPEKSAAKGTAVQAASKPEQDEKKKPAETGAVYSADELANAARELFGVPPEVVRAAFKLADKDKATVDEAKKIVKTFMVREVN